MNNPFCHRSDRDTKSAWAPESNRVYLATQKRKQQPIRGGKSNGPK